MFSITSTLPSLLSMKSILTDRSDSTLSDSGSLSKDSQSTTYYCSKEVQDTQYSMKEITQHCDSQSCWVVIDNAVYDITDFLYDHPGGMDIMLEHAGSDCTGAFQDVGHSQWAVKMLEKYKIGMLRPEERIYI